MDDPFGVRRSQPEQHTADDGGDSLGGQAPFGLEQVFEGPPVHELHHHVVDWLAVLVQPVGPEVVELRDVWVAKLSHDPRLLVEALARARVGQEIGADRFEGDLAVDGELASPVHGPHAAAPQVAFHPEAPRQHPPQQVAGALWGAGELVGVDQVYLTSPGLAGGAHGDRGVEATLAAWTTAGQAAPSALNQRRCYQPGQRGSTNWAW